MSASQTQQQKKQRKIFSNTVKAEIKKKPYTQPINGIQYTYGLLEKKSESSIFNNQRFLIIKGHQTFGYASSLPDDTLLPFVEVKNIPKCKAQVPLEKLQISHDKQVLIVEFQEDGKKQKTKWEFACGSKAKAIEWRKKLQIAKEQRVLSLKNKAVKVILQDPNENVQESENEAQKKKKIVSNNNNIIQNALQQRLHNLPIEDKQNKILVRDEDLDDGKRLETPKNNIVAIQTKQQPQKFPEVNIFESLLYSSPTREVEATSKLVSDLSRQKSIQNSREKSQQSIIDQQKRSADEVTPNKSREEFLKRKREDSELKEELRDENTGPSFLGSLVKTLADNKYQIDKLKKEWNYEFAKGINEFEIVERFKIYVEIIAVRIVDELALEPGKRYYKPVSETSQSLQYELEGVTLEFFLHELKEVTSFEKKGSIISKQASKRALQEFKNYDYILQITNNKGRIRVPLAMTVEYKGFVCLAKAIFPEGQSYDSMEYLQKQLDLLQVQSRINNSIFEDGENGRIVPLMSKAYEKLARAQNNYSNNNAKKFEICYIQGLRHYLPQDFYSYKTQGGKNQQPINPVHVLRKQFIQDDDYCDTVFYGDNMANVIQRLKIPQNMKNAIDNLTEVVSSIPDRVNALVTALENMDEFITNSHDLSKLVHSFGLNMRYLGLILERAHQSWLQSMVMSEIAARCAKHFLQFDLQDCILNLNETKLQNVRRYQVKQVITFLNKILGSSEESDLFWNQLSRQAQENFQCYVDKKNLNIGYFVQALESQCRVQLINVLDRKQDFFKVVQPLTVDNFVGFQLNSKTYDLSFTQLYTKVSHRIKDISQESFEQLSILLNLQRKGQLASHFKLSGFDQKIILYMINWLSPTEGRHIYYPQEIVMGEVKPTKTLYQIKLTEIKWLLKQKRQQEAETVRDWIVEHVNKWLGEYHPVLSQLYDLLSRYYSLSKTEQKRAITYCKSSIKNIEKLLGQSNIKLADNYFMLAQIYINYQKKTEALSSLRRAREILDAREGQETQAYGIIELRIGQLLLASGNFKEALDQSARAYSRLHEASDLEKFVECLELVGRCYELEDNTNGYLRFVEELISETSKLQQLANNAQLLQRTLKVMLLPYFMAIGKNAQITKQLLTALSSFPSSTNTPTSVQNQSYSYIKSLIHQRIQAFPQQFLSILQTDLQELLEVVEYSGIMARWKGIQTVFHNNSPPQKMNSVISLNPKAYEFLFTLEALSTFLGEGWIQGVLTLL